MRRTQDPKYDIENGKLVNAATRAPIPDDEPIFILRAKDVHTVPTLTWYGDRCANEKHRASVYTRVQEFRDFAADHQEQMKEPDSAPRDPRPIEHFIGDDSNELTGV